MMEALQFDFMRNALIAGLLVSITGGIIGCFVVVNRIVFITAGFPMRLMAALVWASSWDSTLC